jgi:type I restriction enzyme S subunit
MTQLTQGWLNASLEDLGAAHCAGVWGADPDVVPTLRRVKIVRNGDISPRGVIRWYALPARGLTKREIEKAKLQPGDVLVTTSGDVGKTAIWPDLGGSCESLFGASNFVRRIRGPTTYLSRWIYYYLRSTQANELFQEHARGVAIQNLSGQFWTELRLPVAPFKEQHRIVEAIESCFTRLDDAVATLVRVQRNLKRYRASVLKAAVEGRLVPTEAELARTEGRDYEPASVLLERILAERRRRWDEAELAKMKAKGKTPKDDKWKAKYEEPVAPDTEGLPELPEGWHWSSLGELFDVRVGATPSRAKPEYWNGGIPWISSGEVSFCRIGRTRETISEEGLRNSSTQLNPAGSVLLGMIGEGKTRGQAAILSIAACNNQNSAAIWVGAAGLPPEYVYYFLMGQYEVTRTRGSGNNQPALNKSRVQAIPFPLPPLAEAHRIVAHIEKHESAIESQDKSSWLSLARCARLRQSILKWAFEGRLVDQNPTDEPAAALLERIRAERASADGKKSRGRQGVPEDGGRRRKRGRKQRG